MRTSFDIPDSLLKRAKALARQRRTTLRAVFLEGLRRVLDEQTTRRSAYELPDESFGEGGVCEGVRLSDWERMRELIYEGRGG